MLKHLPTMWETGVQSLGREDLLEKEMVTHSYILAWKIPWMEEPGRLHSMGSQRVGHDWATSLHLDMKRCKDEISSDDQSCPTLWLHESQHARPPCPSPTRRVYSNSCPSSQWCHPAISSSVVPFSSCPQSFPALGSFPVSQHFAWGG